MINKAIYRIGVCIVGHSVCLHPSLVDRRLFGIYDCKTFSSSKITMEIKENNSQQFLQLATKNQLNSDISIYMMSTYTLQFRNSITNRLQSTILSVIQTLNNTSVTTYMQYIRNTTN